MNINSPICNLVLIYESGYGVVRDIGLAKNFYTAAAENGLADAQRKLGALCWRQVPEDFAGGLRWLSEAATQGDAEAIDLTMHRIVLDTRDRASEIIDGSNWLSKAMEMEGPQGDYLAGIILAHARGCGDKEASDAIQLLWPSAQGGAPLAQMTLGHLFAQGKGTEQDLELAYSLFDMVARSNDFGADARDALANQLTPLQISRGKARWATLEYVATQKAVAPD